ncbi:MAG: glycoside hydrolase family 18 protein [Psychromonas sp.]
MLNIKKTCLGKIKLFACLLLACTLSACDGLFSSDIWDLDSTCDEDTPDVDFKKVAYWIKDDINDLEDIADSDNDIDYSQLTHLIFGYIYVNADGSFDINSDGTLSDIDDSDDLKDIIDDLQNDGVEVFFSIGGTANSANLETIAADDDLTDDFINNIVDLVDEYGLDGIDLSWQYPETDDEGELFEDLVEALSDELDDQGTTFTIEVLSGLDEEEDYADVIDSDVFDYVDFVNVKGFNDNNDEGADGDDDLYLTTDDFSDVIDYWTDRCLIQNKLVVSIPVFGTTEDAATETYSDIVNEKTDKSTFACDDDDNASISGVTYYFNAIPTVVEKTAYAESYAGGILLKSLDQDYNEDSEYSLLNAISDEIDGTGSICD